MEHSLYKKIKSNEPLNKVIWHPVDKSNHVKSDDIVLGLYINHQAYAIPWWIIKYPHVANLTIGKNTILINYCGPCSSMAVFNSAIDNNLYTFRLIGAYNGTMFISDLETNSFWTPFSGECIAGKFKGTVLERLPSWQLKWNEWLKIHPNTLVAYDNPEIRSKHKGYTPGKGNRIARELFPTLLQDVDTRLPVKTLVLGVKVNNSAKAYSLVELDKYGAIITDIINEQQIVIFHQPKSLLALAFSPYLEQEKLEFEVTAEGKITDKNTGSFWNYTGEAYQGKLKGSQLSYIFSGVQEWYIWAADNPETEIFNNVGGLRFKLANTIPGIGKLFR